MSDARERLTKVAGTDDRPPHWLAEVRAADVVTVCDEVADPDQRVTGLRKGSAAVAAGNPGAKVHVMGHHLRELLAAPAKE